MKKIIYTILIFALMLIFSSCGNTSVVTGDDISDEEQAPAAESTAASNNGSSKSEVLSVYLSTYSMAVIKNDHSFWVWEWILKEQNGDSESYTIIPTEKLEDVVYADIHGDNIAAVKDDGSLWLYGPDPYGVAGASSVYEKGTEQPMIKIMDGVSAVRLGEFNIAVIKEDNSLWIGGKNDYGQIGNGDSGFGVYEPIQKIMDDVSDVVFGDANTVALKQDGSVWTWGGNFSASLGDGSNGDSDAHPYPTMVLEDAESIYTAGNWGFQKTIAIKKDGSMWAWGGAAGADEQYYQGFYDNGVDAWDRATQVTPLKILDSVIDVDTTKSGGGYNNAPLITIVNDAGELYLWGSYSPDGNTLVPLLEPVKVLDNTVKAVVRGTFAAAIQNDGSLWFWGAMSNSSNSTSRDSFTKISDDVADVYIDGRSDLYVLKTDGYLWSWNGEDFKRVFK